MIATFNRVALDTAIGQGQFTVWASILKGYKFAQASDRNVQIFFTQNRDLLQLSCDLVIPSSDIPCILRNIGLPF